MKNRILVLVSVALTISLGCSRGSNEQSRQFKKQSRFGTFTKDAEEVKLNLRAYYQLNSDSLKLFNEKGFFANKKDSIDVVGLYVEPTIRSVARTVLKSYTLKELYQADNHALQEEFWQEAKKLMAGTRTKHGFKVRFNEFILIGEMEYPPLANQASESNLLNEFKLLKSADPNQRSSAIDSLFLIGSENAYSLILNHWAKEKDSNIRANILKRLADER